MCVCVCVGRASRRVLCVPVPRVARLKSCHATAVSFKDALFIPNVPISDSAVFLCCSSLILQRKTGRRGGGVVEVEFPLATLQFQTSWFWLLVESSLCFYRLWGVVSGLPTAVGSRTRFHHLEGFCHLITFQSQ